MSWTKTGWNLVMPPPIDGRTGLLLSMAMYRQRNSAGAFDVNGAIGLCGRLGQNANEVDDRIRSRDCSADSEVVKHIGLDELRCLGGFSRHLNTTGVAYGQAHRRATS